MCWGKLLNKFPQKGKKLFDSIKNLSDICSGVLKRQAKIKPGVGIGEISTPGSDIRMYYGQLTKKKQSE